MLPSEQDVNNIGSLQRLSRGAAHVGHAELGRVGWKRLSEHAYFRFSIGQPRQLSNAVCAACSFNSLAGGDSKPELLPRAWGCDLDSRTTAEEPLEQQGSGDGHDDPDRSGENSQPDQHVRGKQVASGNRHGRDRDVEQEPG